MKEPQHCIVMREARDTTGMGVVVKENLHEGQARLLAIRCSNADKNTNFWAMHHNDCLNMPRDKFFTIPEATL